MNPVDCLINRADNGRTNQGATTMEYRFRLRQTVYYEAIVHGGSEAEAKAVMLANLDDGEEPIDLYEVDSGAMELDADSTVDAALRLAIEALRHSKPSAANYPEPVARHAAAIAACKALLA